MYIHKVILVAIQGGLSEYNSEITKIELSLF